MYLIIQCIPTFTEINILRVGQRSRASTFRNMEGSKLKFCSPRSEATKPHQDHQNLRHILKQYSIGIPTPLPTPQTEAGSISTEITMATIVIGAQWGDEVRTTFLGCFERITFFSLVSGFGDSEDFYLDFY
jgi:hypothetical protein